MIVIFHEGVLYNFYGIYSKSYSMFKLLALEKWKKFNKTKCENVKIFVFCLCNIIKNRIAAEFF